MPNQNQSRRNRPSSPDCCFTRGHFDVPCSVVQVSNLCAYKEHISRSPVRVEHGSSKATRVLREHGYMRGSAGRSVAQVSNLCAASRTSWKLVPLSILAFRTHVSNLCAASRTSWKLVPLRILAFCGTSFQLVLVLSTILAFRGTSFQLVGSDQGSVPDGKFVAIVNGRKLPGQLLE